MFFIFAPRERVTALNTTVIYTLNTHNHDVSDNNNNNNNNDNNNNRVIPPLCTIMITPQFQNETFQ